MTMKTHTLLANFVLDNGLRPKLLYTYMNHTTPMRYTWILYNTSSLPAIVMCVANIVRDICLILGGAFHGIHAWSVDNEAIIRQVCYTESIPTNNALNVCWNKYFYYNSCFIHVLFSICSSPHVTLKFIISSRYALKPLYTIYEISIANQPVNSNEDGIIQDPHRVLWGSVSLIYACV